MAMKKELLVSLHSDFESQMHVEESGCEFWYARELQELLGYSQWRSFEQVVEKAIVACQTSEIDPADHFARVRKLVGIGSRAMREVEDIALSRYACYLIAQNGDSSKEQIAFAQTYFALQTRKMEIIEQRLAEQERINARRKLAESEKVLSGIIFERLGEHQSFARIRSKADSALFGGLSTKQMKDRLSVPNSRSLADFLPTITIKAKDFANEITNFNILRDDLKSESKITQEHVNNHQNVRSVLTNRGIYPENLAPAEDIRKVERRIQSEGKKIPKQADRLEQPRLDNEESGS